tara:strand:- start:588 stop:2660 length:2073 start_codon:yes stop_codon:yes gene_type:complete
MSKKFYFGGTSITKGGGLEDVEYRDDIRPLYRKMGVYLPTQEECSYAHVLSKIFNYECINKSKSGSGTKRTIRKAMDYINTLKLEELKDHLFFFEFTPGIRDDIYFNDEKHWGIMNGHYPEGKPPMLFSLVKDWFTDPEANKALDEKYQPILKKYYDNHFNDPNYHEEEQRLIQMFVQYLTNINAKFYFTLGDGYGHEHMLWFVQDNKKTPLTEHPRCVNRYFAGQDIWTHGSNQKWLISDEVDFEIDNHLGYFGSIKTAYQLSFAISEIASELREETWNFNSKKYLPAEINYWTPEHQLKPLPFEEFPAVHRLKFNYTDDNKKLDCIWVREEGLNQAGDFDKFKNRYKDKVEEVKKVNPNINICFQITQEMWIYTLKKQIEDVVVNEWGLKKSNIKFFDCNAFENPIDCVFKPYVLNPLNVANDGKQINSVVKHSWNTYAHHRRYSISMFNGKFRPDRMYAVDNLFTKTFKTEPLLTIYEKDININNPQFSENNYNIEIKNFKNWEKYVGQSLEHYYPQPKEHNAYSVNYQPMVAALKESYLNIVVETSYLPDEQFGWHEKFGIADQISEKTILPLIQGCAIFLTSDGKINKKLEDYGFNFSYLKDNFGIDYLKNTRRENIESLKKINEVTKNWDSQGWYDWYAGIFDKCILNNRRVAIEAIFTNKTESYIYNKLKNEEVQSNINKRRI